MTRSPTLSRSETLRIATEIAQATDEDGMPLHSARDRMEALALISRLERYDQPRKPTKPPRIPSDERGLTEYMLREASRRLAGESGIAAAKLMEAMERHARRIAELDAAAAEERRRKEDLTRMTPDEATAAVMERLRGKPPAVLQTLHCALRDLMLQRGIPL